MPGSVMGHMDLFLTISYNLFNRFCNPHDPHVKSIYGQKKPNAIGMAYIIGHSVVHMSFIRIHLQT